MKQPTLQIQNLTKYYGKIKGVENLSLQLYAGEIFGFIGPNGAGKSTTIRCIMHLINPTAAKPTKTISQLADEVIAGKWGNGQDRINRLKKAGYDPAAVQNKVNQKLK